MIGADPAGRFRDLTSGWPEGVWRAPGRVNLIGEHTDYNDGLALPFAIERETTVALRRRPDRRVRCWSAQDGEPADVDIDGVCGMERRSIPAWARYPVGVLWAFVRAGFPVPGLDLVVDSTVPMGGGLASSAALEAAVAVGVSELTGIDLDRRLLVELCHAAEAEFAGVPVGYLDQFAVLCGRAGHGLLVDFRSFEADVLPLRIGPIVVVDTNVRHSNADGAYAARRRSCREAAGRLGITSLRDATIEMVSERIEGDVAGRARHVVTENSRVLEAAQRLRAGQGIGDLLYASHASLRDDYQVSCPELDAVVETALDIGAEGARLTGAGLGGCAIVVGLDAGLVSEAAARTFRDRGYRQPAVFEVIPAAGAGRLI